MLTVLFFTTFVNSYAQQTLSDFVVAIEDGKSKMLVYMAGEIKIE